MTSSEWAGRQAAFKEIASVRARVRSKRSAYKKTMRPEMVDFMVLEDLLTHLTKRAKKIKGVKCVTS